MKNIEKVFVHENKRYFKTSTERDAFKDTLDKQIAKVSAFQSDMNRYIESY